MRGADFAAICEREQLQAVLAYVGSDQHLYICGVDRGFHAHYHKAMDEKSVVRCKTSYRAVFESVSRLTLAVQCGLELAKLHGFAHRSGVAQVKCQGDFVEQWPQVGSLQHREIGVR